MFKKLILLLTIIITCCVISIGASAGYSYDENTKTATVTGVITAHTHTIANRDYQAVVPITGRGDYPIPDHTGWDYSYDYEEIPGIFPKTFSATTGGKFTCSYVHISPCNYLAELIYFGMIPTNKNVSDFSSDSKRYMTQAAISPIYDYVLINDGVWLNYNFAPLTSYISTTYYNTNAAYVNVVDHKGADQVWASADGNSWKFISSIADNNGYGYGQDLKISTAYWQSHCVSSPYYTTYQISQQGTYLTPMDGRATNTVSLVDVTATNVNFNFGAQNVKVRGGSYQGSPAFTGSNVTIRQGTLVDLNNTHSQYRLYSGSTQSTSSTNGTTVTTINPPPDNAPPVTTITRSTTALTDRVTLTVSCYDALENDHPQPISINGGAFVASPASATFYSNQNVSVTTRDAIGNSQTQYVNITNIDSAPPSVSISKSTTAQTNGSITFTVTATDDMGLAATPYWFYKTPAGGAQEIIKTTSNALTVSDPCTVYCVVYDGFGRSTQSATLYSDNIDKIAPTTSFSRSSARPTFVNTSPGVTVTISATDPKNGLNNASGLHSSYVFWQDQGSWSGSNTRTFSSNGTYYYRVRDAVGNESGNVAVTIDNIDASPPNVSIAASTTGWTNGNVTITATASDDLGLSTTPYKFTVTNLKTNATTNTTQASNTFTITDISRVTCTVTDVAGKTKTSNEITVGNIDKIAPTANVSMSIASGEYTIPSVGVTVTIGLENTADNRGNCSDMSGTPVKWTDVGTWTTSLTRTFTANGTYKFRVRDSVGNESPEISVVINQIITGVPNISLTASGEDLTYRPIPVTLTANASTTCPTGFPLMAYSWDGGMTWSANSTKDITANGTYGVMVKDKAGAVASKTIVISNIDGILPTANTSLYKAPPADDPDAEEKDYVWWMNITAMDNESGISRIVPSWSCPISYTNTLDWQVTGAGQYTFDVYDVCGNKTTITREITAEEIYIPPNYVYNLATNIGITTPRTGSAGEELGAPIGDLVFGANGVYNRVTNTYTPYTPGNQGMRIHLLVKPQSSTYASGYVTFNSVRYPVTFENDEEYLAGRDLFKDAYAFIPSSVFTSDVRNGRVTAFFQEYNSTAEDAVLMREGSYILYANIQSTKPRVNYTYNRQTNTVTIIATSSVAGIKSCTITKNGVTEDCESTVVVPLTGLTSLSFTATDNVQNVETLNISFDDIASGASNSTLPTVDKSEAVAGDVNTYYIASRFSEAYIVGGTRNNTSSLPSAEVINKILGD